MQALPIGLTSLIKQLFNVSLFLLLRPRCSYYEHQSCRRALFTLFINRVVEGIIKTQVISIEF